MTTESATSKISVRTAFVLGAGSALVVGALAMYAIRHDGRTDAIAQPAPQQVAVSAPEIAPLVEAPVVPATELKAPAAGHMSTTPAPAAQTSNLISGTIGIDPAIASSFSGKLIVFVIARTGTGKGHPVFAKRIDVTSFPVPFSLGSQDSMMGGTPPEHVSLEARIDLDGDAMTREANAPSVKNDSVAIGTHGVTLTLKRGV